MRSWPHSFPASGIPYDDTVTNLGTSNVQDAIEYLATNAAPPASSESRNVFLKVLRVGSSSSLQISQGGTLAIARGSNQLNILIGIAKILSGSGLEISAGSGLQIKV